MHTRRITIMNRRLLSFASAAVLALAAAPTLAQQLPAVAPPSSNAALVGHWLHDSRGGIIGSIKSVSPDGHTATVVLGVYKFDNVRVIEVPASALAVVDGKATLRGETAEALNASPLR